MSSKRLFLGSLGAACSLLALALACGGKGGNSPDPRVPATSLGGAWTATGSGGGTSYTLVMPSDGTFRTFSANGSSVLSGKLLLSGQDLSGNLTFFFPEAMGITALPATLSGTGSKTGITFTLAASDPDLNNRMLTSAPDPLANAGAQLKQLEGTWTSAPSGNDTSTALTLTVDAAGNVSATSPAGTLQGTFIQPTAGANAFVAAYAYTPTAGANPGKAQSFSGSAYLRDNGGQLILAADNGKGGMGGVFTKQ
ncbi:hypothetical protein [Mesoterricola silvestris]|uniref:Lipoprotein n=1 Tax=Mesoterricola silvestris TaxID=2927979 RepID=A0AA48GLG1_9BACT|nr:hypothetical protein [Mesoterricola silvestris]BDU73449.1 hypothetical protein METEAL_26230 [Mesoterricola silvestris]